MLARIILFAIYAPSFFVAVPALFVFQPVAFAAPEHPIVTAANHLVERLRQAPGLINDAAFLTESCCEVGGTNLEVLLVVSDLKDESNGPLGLHFAISPELRSDATRFLRGILSESAIKIILVNQLSSTNEMGLHQSRLSFPRMLLLRELTMKPMVRQMLVNWTLELDATNVRILASIPWLALEALEGEGQLDKHTEAAVFAAIAIVESKDIQFLSSDRGLAVLRFLNSAVGRTRGNQGILSRLQQAYEGMCTDTAIPPDRLADFTVQFSDFLQIRNPIREDWLKRALAIILDPKFKQVANMLLDFTVIELGARGLSEESFQQGTPPSAEEGGVAEQFIRLGLAREDVEGRDVALLSVLTNLTINLKPNATFRFSRPLLTAALDEIDAILGDPKRAAKHHTLDFDRSRILAALGQPCPDVESRVLLVP